jgi:hypothetical protein
VRLAAEDEPSTGRSREMALGPGTRVARRRHRLRGPSALSVHPYPMREPRLQPGMASSRRVLARSLGPVTGASELGQREL